VKLRKKDLFTDKHYQYILGKLGLDMETEVRRMTKKFRNFI
jgi:hypothetical protein